MAPLVCGLLPASEEAGGIGLILFFHYSVALVPGVRPAGLCGKEPDGLADQLRPPISLRRAHFHLAQQPPGIVHSDYELPAFRTRLAIVWFNL